MPKKAGDQIRSPAFLIPGPVYVPLIQLFWMKADKNICCNFFIDRELAVANFEDKGRRAPDKPHLTAG